VSQHFEAIVFFSNRTTGSTQQADPAPSAMRLATASLRQRIKFSIQRIAVFNAF